MEKIWVKWNFFVTDRQVVEKTDFPYHCHWVWNIGMLKFSSPIPTCPAKFWGSITRQFTLIPADCGWSVPLQKHSNLKELCVICQAAPGPRRRDLFCFSSPPCIVRTVSTTSNLLYKGIKTFSVPICSSARSRTTSLTSLFISSALSWCSASRWVKGCCRGWPGAGKSGFYNETKKR